MKMLRRLVATLMSKGVISPAWYSILTGVAMLYVARGLWSVGGTDAAAPVVAIGMAAAGVWCLQRGIRLEVRRRRSA